MTNVDDSMSAPRGRVLPHAAAMILCLLAGCATARGPRLVADSHIEYNKAVSQVLGEELLLNIVRRRYMEAPQFISVDSISASLDVSKNIGVSGSYDISDGDSKGLSYGFSTGSGLSINDVPTSSSNWSPLTLNAGVSFSESPTITLTPRQGEDIAGPLHTAMKPSILSELANVGYRLDLLLLLLVQDINGVRSVEAGVGESFRGGSPEFCELIKLARALSLQNDLVVGSFQFEDPYNDAPFGPDQISPELWLTAVATEARWRSYDDGKGYYLTDHKMYPALWMTPEAKDADTGQRLMELLNLQPAPLKQVWPFKSAKTIAGPDLSIRPDARRDNLKIRMRSFYSVMNLLAYGVAVPPDHTAEGVAFPRDSYDDVIKTGRFEDVAGYFNIKSDKARPQAGLMNHVPILPEDDGPKAAYITVHYRGHWFYIDDADLVSKRIFNAMYDLFNLQVAPSSGGSAPVLTLPVK